MLLLCSLYALKDESYLRQHLEKQHTALRQATISYTVSKYFLVLLKLKTLYISKS